MAEDRVKRKLAAIVSADVVGWSRLMGEDEAGTLATLKRHREELIDPKIEEYGGRIVSTAGDSVLVEYPSAVDAVRCFVEIQDAMVERNADLPEDKKMLFRVGINLGEVIIDGDDVFGDGVNVAARLQTLSEPGAVCLSGDVQRQVRGKLDMTFIDLGEKTVKNIAKAVRVYSVSAGKDETEEVSDVSEALPLPSKPSIAVLSFTNMSGDPEQEYFSDGIADEIIAGLSRFRDLFVIARNSSFTYKGSAVDIHQVGRELGVRYVLEGGVRKAGKRVRILVQLIDAATGNHLWAEKYDGDLDHVFDLQDKITMSVAGAIQPQLFAAEMESAKRSRAENLDAYSMCLRGWWHASKIRRDEQIQARRCFMNAISIDQTFAQAYSALAWMGFVDYELGWTDDLEATIREAVEAGQRAISLDESDALAHALLAFASLFSRRFEAATAEAERALELNPNLPFAYAARGVLRGYTGRAQDGSSLRRQPGITFGRIAMMVS